ncbi:MAG TPA: amylo-alpha-1,6-glucosidase [Oculatellaceae cyanobacterium]|jgi:4-alpha-glucanotransferase
MDKLDTREWLLTNGLGSFASGTISDAHTRTYHGWLIAAVNPPQERTLLLSHLDASLEVDGRVFALKTNFWGDGTISPLGYQLLHSFDINLAPTWLWGEDDWQLNRQIIMPYGVVEQVTANTCNLKLSNRILIQYRYQGKQMAILKLRPLIGDRNFHHQQSAQGLNFSQILGSQHICLQAFNPGWQGTFWHLRWSAGEYQSQGVWNCNYYYLEENKRGLGDREDLYCPGYLTVKLQPGDAVTLEARVGLPDSEQPLLNNIDFDQAVQTESQRLTQLFGNQILNDCALGSANKLKVGESQEQTYNPNLLWHQLLRSSDQFIAYRASIAEPTVIAGYPWFNDWGRDTLIALPGLALATKRFSLAKGLLKTFGHYCRNGLIPNTFPDYDAEPIYNSIDASLWWIETLGLYLEATQDWEFLVKQYPVFQQIYTAFCNGTLYNIQVDSRDGLLNWQSAGVAITWMDVVLEGKPITPRYGKSVEINALWYSALCWAIHWTEKLEKQGIFSVMSWQHQRNEYTQRATQVKLSLQKFWNPAQQYFYDTIEPDDQPNSQIRPNAVLALSLYHCGFSPEQGRAVLKIARDRLLTPYGLRSLDPADPDYIGNYAGDRFHRDAAYHQGTVWSWLIGSFSRAWKRFYESEPIPFDWQPLLDHFQQQACLGSISEIFDGNPPHLPQGAFAQAWSVAEVIRQHFVSL